MSENKSEAPAEASIDINLNPDIREFSIIVAAIAEHTKVSVTEVEAIIVKIRDDDVDLSEFVDKEFDVVGAIMELDESQKMVIMNGGYDCPVCGAPLRDINGKVLCVRCFKKSYRKPTLKNALSKVALLRETYKVWAAIGKVPTITRDELYGLFPGTLAGVTFEEIAELKKTGYPEYSRNQRMFCNTLLQVLEYYDQAVAQAELNKNKVKEVAEAE